MTKRRRQGWMLFLAGLLLLAGAWLLLRLLPQLLRSPRLQRLSKSCLNSQSPLR